MVSQRALVWARCSSLRRSAFTLVELLVVIAIIGVLVALQEPVDSTGNQLPTKYSVPQTSGLTATVREEPNEFNFELTD